jgi:hypothetical protein
MKAILSTVVCLAMFALPLQLIAQIEVHDNGKVDIGGNGFTGTRPSCHTFICGSTGAVLNSVQINHNNMAGNSEAITTQLVSPYNVSYEVHVNSSPGTFYVTGWGGIFYQGGWLTSDSSTKKNIRQLEDPLEKIHQLNGYTYYKKNFIVPKGQDSGKTFESDTFMHMGIMANEVEKIAPYMVREMANGKKAVDYIQLIPLLIESIKKLDANNKAAEDEIALLNARYNKLVSDLDTSDGKYLLKQSAPSQEYILYQNTPNPFNTETKISYSLKSSYSSAYIYVFDLQGGLKKTFVLSGSNASVTIKAADLSAGMYIYSLVVDGKEIDTKRMILTN